MVDLLVARTAALVQVPVSLRRDEILVLISLLLPLETVHGCDQGWFGQKCQFKCHCTPLVICLMDGQCLGGKPCESGYFGPACQYEDLAQRRATADTPGYVRDGNDSNCNQDSRGTSVSVTLNASLPVCWFRIHTNRFAHLLSFTVKINNGTLCKDEKRFIQGRHEVDVVCSQPVLMTELRVEGDIAPTICSIYISGGRNVALRQFTNQTSTFSSITGADNAVDGDPRTEAAGSKCAQTRVDDPPRWVLYFDSPQLLTRVRLVNSASIDVMRGFSLQARSISGSIVDLYTEASSDVQEYFDIILLSKVATSLLQIVGARRNITTLQYLKFCELQAFGDRHCPRGMYGLECQRPCTCTQTQHCHPVTGVCAHTCLPGKFGFNCAYSCSLDCYPRVCSPDSGACFYCYPGLKGVYCDVECDRGTYGLDCASLCPSRCASDCNATTGECTTCNEGFYGENCSHLCPERCSDKVCHIETGDCIRCSANYVGLKCEAYDENVSSNRSVIWVVLPTLVLLFLLIASFYWCRQHTRNDGEEDESFANTFIY